MAMVPAHHVKWKTVDYDGEIFACLGVPCVIAKHSFKPPSIGVFSLLEVIDSKIVNDFQHFSLMDFYRAAYILIHRQESAEDVREWKRDKGAERFEGQPSDWHPFDKKVYAYFKDTEFTVSDMINFRSFLLDNTFAGYEMIPNSCPSGNRPYIFGADTLASIVRALLGSGIPIVGGVIWDLPLCIIGFISAARAAENGVKGVGRPKDLDDIKLQLKQANERESKGELHPWQIEEPHIYRPSEIQEKANPDIKRLHNDALKAYLKKERDKNQVEK
jgi:hypothetical protein